MEAGGHTTTASSRPPRRLWPWFAAGFLAVFAGMLLLVHMTAMHPSGQYAVRSPLWQYYATSLPRLFGPSTLGPASGGTSALLGTALFHLLLSAAGGGLAGAAGWLRRRRAAEQGAAADRGRV